jgi:hypothetical protein
VRKLSGLMKDALGRDEVVRAGRAQIVLQEWDEVVGPVLGQRSHPDRYDHGTVFVAVSGSEWAQELRMSKETILSRLRERGRDSSLFTDVRFGVRPFEKTTPILNEPFPEEERKSELRGLSIREIAERRIKAMIDKSQNKPE